MNLSKTRDFLGKFSYLNIFHYSAMACYYPFIVAFLTKRDYSSTQIGAILTIDSIVAIISQPIWGIICDRIRSVRKVYIALAIVIS
ncbi:MAG: MFS transporter, partial [Oscillospiraceae bacterium]|nr:MFS transporter [Oscillospiraceae bacterium]